MATVKPSQANQASTAALLDTRSFQSPNNWPSGRKSVTEEESVSAHPSATLFSPFLGCMDKSFIGDLGDDGVGGVEGVGELDCARNSHGAFARRGSDCCRSCRRD